MSKPLIVLAALATVSTPALAQGLYADAGYTFITIDVEEEGASGEVELGAISGRIGYNFSEWIAVEAEGAIGVELHNRWRGAL